MIKVESYPIRLMHLFVHCYVGQQVLLVLDDLELFLLFASASILFILLNVYFGIVPNTKFLYCCRLQFLLEDLWSYNENDA